MSFKYRTIGYSPEYAITTGSTYNDFHNENNFQSGSLINLKLGSTTVAETGALLRITDAPTNPLDATNMLYVDTKLPLAGGTMTGLLVLSGDPAAAMNPSTKQYTDLRIHKDGSVQMTGDLLLRAATDPTLADHAARKAYVDTKLAIAGGTMGGFITLHAHPTASYHPATRAYVDGKLGTFDAGDGLFVVPVSSNKSGTYSQTGDVITVTIVNHGFGAFTALDVDFTTGTPSSPVDGSYTIVTVSGPDTFTLAAADSVSRTGNVTTTFNTNQVSVASTTLQVNADDIQLKATTPVTSNTAWYDQVKVDQYGRVSAAQATPLVNAVDGFYNKVRIQGGYVTQANLEPYLTENQTVTLTGDISGSGKTAITANLSVMPGLADGTYTKLTVNSKGRVTAAGQLSSSDITTALGYVPPQGSAVQYTYLKSTFQSSQWGTAPFNLTYNSGSTAGYSFSGTFMYIPRGVYQITYYGSNNWWQTYYSNWWYYWSWWGSYWTYYYQPAAIYLNGKVTTSAFSNYGGWWWYWNNRFHSDVAQDFCLNDTVEVTTDGSYFQFGVPHLAGVKFWTNIKILKLK
jgi:hypothetical protein